MKLFIFIILFILTSVFSFSEPILKVTKFSKDELVQMTKFEFPKFEYGDILKADSSTALEIAHTLTSLGFLQIRNIPDFKDSRKETLSSLSDCFESESENVKLTTMHDGSKRFTVAALSNQGRLQPATNKCVDKTSSHLRATVDNVTKQLFKVLDLSVRSDSLLLDPYRSFEDIISNGQHLEHFHTFSPNVDDSFDKSTISPTFEFHTDNGVMIAMTVGLYNQSPLAEGGLYVELPNGSIARASVDEDSLIIMVGEGAKWLQPVLGLPLRPVSHAMIAGLKSSTAIRSWYGKMILPPMNAILRPTPTSEGLTFESYRRRTTIAANDLSLPIACGAYVSSNVDSSRILTGLSNTLCKADDDTVGVYCWKSCLSVADTSTYPCGTSAVCVDTTTGEVNDGTDHCPSGMTNCELECLADPYPSGATNSSFVSDYCYGTGTTMYMDYFTSMAFSSKGTVACLNLFFKSWTLNTDWKFALACIGIFFSSVAIQFMTTLRGYVKKESSKLGFIRYVTISVLLYGVQVVLSYLIMLAAMTYSVELFAMVCAGLTAGYALFNMELPVSLPEPCCDLEGDDATKSNYETLEDSSSHTYKAS